MINFEILSKIKTVSIIFVLSFISVIITFIMYQTLDMNGNNLKMESESLKNKLVKLNNETKKAIEEANKSIEFLNKHNLTFININNQFDLISFSNKLKKELEELYPDIKLNTKENLKKTKSILYKFPITLEFTYINPYYFNRLIDYFNNKYFYELENFTYKSNNKRFTFKANLFSKQKIKILFKNKIKNKKKNL